MRQTVEKEFCKQLLNRGYTESLIKKQSKEKHKTHILLQINRFISIFPLLMVQSNRKFAIYSNGTTSMSEFIDSQISS